MSLSLAILSLSAFFHTLPAYGLFTAHTLVWWLNQMQFHTWQLHLDMPTAYSSAAVGPLRLLWVGLTTAQVLYWQRESCLCRRKAQAAAPRSSSTSVVREVPVRFPPCLSVMTRDICFPLEEHCFVLETALWWVGHTWCLQKCECMKSSWYVLYTNPVRLGFY